MFHLCSLVVACIAGVDRPIACVLERVAIHVTMYRTYLGRQRYILPRLRRRALSTSAEFVATYVTAQDPNFSLVFFLAFILWNDVWRLQLSCARIAVI